MRVDILNKVLVELVGRTAPVESESTGLLRVAWEHGQAMAGTLGERRGRLTLLADDGRVGA